MPRPQALVLTVDPDTREIEELVFALGLDVAAVVRQNRGRPDPQTFLGSGKLEEARDAADRLGVRLVVVNDSLKPSQIFNLATFFGERRKRAPGGPDAADSAAARGGRARGRRTAADAGLDLDLPLRDAGPEGAGAGADATESRHDYEPPDVDGVEVFDRLRLILEIFTERARSPEARLQVELAKLQYEMPIVKEYIHLAKKGEHPGFLGGGEYEVNTYYDMMKSRIARIRRDLDRISRERDVRRKHRRRSGFHLVSLAGYTNAGKSSLLRALATPPPGEARVGAYRGHDILVENRYFSTLATRTRRAESAKRDILVTDTVGFIDDLPAWVVEAFHSTLEEIALADVVLLVADASDPPGELVRKVRASLRTLWEFEGPDVPARRGPAPRAAGAAGDHVSSRVLLVLNKSDRVARSEVEERVARLREEGLVGDAWVAVSARTREGLDVLFERVFAALPEYDAFDVALPLTPESEAFIAWAHEHADVLSLTRGNETHLRFETNATLRHEVERRLAACRATRLRESFAAPESTRPAGASSPGSGAGDARAADGAPSSSARGPAAPAAEPARPRER